IIPFVVSAHVPRRRRESNPGLGRLQAIMMFPWMSAVLQNSGLEFARICGVRGCPQPLTAATKAVPRRQAASFERQLRVNDRLLLPYADADFVKDVGPHPAE